MTATESKEDISDNDSGIILHSGPDSPTSPVKDPTTHTRALKLKHQSLEERLELCLLELRKLCIREAELTGTMPPDFPLMPDETLPRVRRRIGASFKLDEGLIHLDQQDSELHALETDLALQRQIYEAARRLSREGNLSKPQKKSRLRQCKREEEKVRDLQEAVFQQRIKSGCNSPCVGVGVPRDQHRDVSDDSSLSDVAALDDDVDTPGPLSPPPLGPSHSDPIQLSAKTQQPLGQISVGYERCPIQNAPWAESNLDQPYDKASRLPSARSSRSSSPAAAQAPTESSRIPLTQFVRNSTLRHSHSTSAPSTPELHIRRQYTQSFRLPKSRLTADKERPGPDAHSPLRPRVSSSEDSGSEHSSSSCMGCGDGPAGTPRMCPPPYGFHLGAQKAGAQRTPSRPQPGPAHARAAAGHVDLDPGRHPPPPQRQRQEGALSPRRILRPPPPYTRLARTPSLKEYPSHAVRPMPREAVSEELRSWHQRNQQQKAGAPGGTSPTSPHLPPFKQGSGNVILQRAADGTPLQWFVAEDAEIVSQV
ncbi:innate immunity activator protein [Betta splendens]|uniref:Innate immunity activator protein n=1 Tax=Betta splendens TaxID=158456 RepID=A0A6P7N4K0_BETSP|nr:innate immunity activator protein [Betta splendens]